MSKNYLLDIPDSMFMDELYGSSSGSAGTQQQSLTGGAGMGPQTTTGPLLGGLTSAQIAQMLQGISIGMTNEEKEEFERLKVEYQHEVKKQKLSLFKKCNPELRQFVINAITWKEVSAEMNSVIVDKSERLKELENKDSLQSMMSSSSKIHWQSTSYAPFDPSLVDTMMKYIGLPDGVTAEELKQVHLEATLEEEMLDGQKEE